MKKNDSSRYSLSGIKSWPEEDRPREKLLKHGEHNLSNTELLAVLLGSGTKGKSAVSLAREIFSRFKSFRKISNVDLSKLRGISGLGKAKISKIKAAVEIGRRFNEEKIIYKKTKIKSSKDIVDIFMPRMIGLKKEVFKTAFLDSKNRIIDIEEIAEGTVNYANPIIREIFHKALQKFASSVICVHNHPGGDSKPSKEDKKFTEKLSQGGISLQVKVLDHIIIGNDEYFSFSDEGII